MYVNKKWSEFIMEIPAADKDSVLLCSTMGFNVIRVKRESDAYRAYVEKTTDHLTTTQESTLEKSEYSNRLSAICFLLYGAAQTKTYAVP